MKTSRQALGVLTQCETTTKLTVAAAITNRGRLKRRGVPSCVLAQKVLDEIGTVFAYPVAGCMCSCSSLWPREDLPLQLTVSMRLDARKDRTENGVNI